MMFFKKIFKSLKRRKFVNLKRGDGEPDFASGDERPASKEKIADIPWLDFTTSLEKVAKITKIENVSPNKRKLHFERENKNYTADIAINCKGPGAMNYEYEIKISGPDKEFSAKGERSTLQQVKFALAFKFSEAFVAK